MDKLLTAQQVTNDLWGAITIPESMQKANFKERYTWLGQLTEKIEYVHTEDNMVVIFAHKKAVDTFLARLYPDFYLSTSGYYAEGTGHYVDITQICQPTEERPAGTIKCGGYHG